MREAVSVEQGLRAILEAAPVLPAETAPLDEAPGRILAEDVRADADVPLFDKSLMDGYAVVSCDTSNPPEVLKVIEEIPAGASPDALKTVRPGTAARIMTGAPMPPGADAVVVVEETEAEGSAGEAVRIRTRVARGENVAARGADVRAGTLVLQAGDFIGAGEVGVLAACGRAGVQVFGRPRVAVLATGDELVPVADSPGPGRIRNSNGPLLAALARRTGAAVRDLGIARDDETALRAAIADGLRSDLLLLSGGVSMGVYDLVAATLRALGVEILFERVAIKPGRPFHAGRRGSCLVCACPGNPVSSYVTFQVFVRPALRRMMGFRQPRPAPVRAALAAPLRQRPGRTGYYEARVGWEPSGFAVEVLPTSGSADFVSCARGNALAIVPTEVTSLAAGESVEVLLLDDYADR